MRHTYDQKVMWHTHDKRVIWQTQDLPLNIYTHIHTLTHTYIFIMCVQKCTNMTKESSGKHIGKTRHTTKQGIKRNKTSEGIRHPNCLVMQQEREREKERGRDKRR